MEHATTFLVNKLGSVSQEQDIAKQLNLFRKKQRNVDMFIHNTLKYKNEFLYDKKIAAKMPVLFKDAFLVKFSGNALT